MNVASVLVALAGLAGEPAGTAPPDVLPPGHHAVVHELVIEPSRYFLEGRIVATPVQGFDGVHVVVPGEPFRFSSKYGTRFYYAKEGTDAYSLRSPEPGRRLNLPWAHPPITEVRSALVGSPVRRALTTLRIARVRGGRIHLDVVDHELFDADGKPVSSGWPLWIWVPVIALGVLVCRRVARAYAEEDVVEDVD